MADTENISLPLQELITFIENEYEPTTDYLKATKKISTHELYLSIMQMFPIENFTEQILFQYLKDMGFHYCDSGNFTIEWLMIKK